MFNIFKKKVVANREIDKVAAIEMELSIADYKLLEAEEMVITSELMPDHTHRYMIHKLNVERKAVTEVKRLKAKLKAAKIRRSSDAARLADRKQYEKERSSSIELNTLKNVILDRHGEDEYISIMREAGLAQVKLHLIN